MEPDAVLIDGLRLEAIVGIDPREREAPQEIEADLVLRTDVRRPAATDRIEDALDYRALSDGLRREAMRDAPSLLESLAARLAGWILDTFPVESVTVTLRKPRALPGASAAGVRITRARADGGDAPPARARGSRARRLSG